MKSRQTPCLGVLGGKQVKEHRASDFPGVKTDCDLREHPARPYDRHHDLPPGGASEREASDSGSGEELALPSQEK